MIRTGQEGGRGAGIFRDLAPIAAAAAAAAMTVTLVVGPTTSRLRAQSGEAPEAALAAEDAPTVPGGDIRVRVRPRPPAPVEALTDTFDLVSGPDTSSEPSAPLTFIVSARPQQVPTVRTTVPLARADDASSLVEIPSASVPSPAAAVVVPDVVVADVPTKRPVRPLKPVNEPGGLGRGKDRPAEPGAPAPKASAAEKAKDKAADRPTDKASEPTTKQEEKARKAEERAAERAEKAEAEAAEQAKKDEQRAKKADEKAAKSKK